MINEILVLRLRWAGHVKLMDENELARRIMKYKPEGVKSRGRLSSNEGMVGG